MSAGYNQLSDFLWIAGCGWLTGIHPALKWRSPAECQHPIRHILCTTGTENAEL